MYTIKQLYYSAFVSALIFRSAVAWTTSDLAVDLTWPPFSHDGYFTQNGQAVAPNVDPTTFPCASIPPPASTTLQTEFPLAGARLQFDVKNSSSQSADYRFMVDTYLGQFSNDADPKKTSWTYVSTLIYEDIVTGSRCTDPINVTNEVATAPEFDMQLVATDSSSLVGVSFTLGLRMVLFHGDNNYEEMYQCSYLNLVAADAPVTQDRGVCNSGSDGTISSSSSSAAPAATSSGYTSSMTTAPSSTLVTAPTMIVGGGDTSITNDSAEHKSRIIGIAVGSSVGAAAFLLILGFFLIRRKRSRGSKTDSAPNSWVPDKEDQYLGTKDTKMRQQYGQDDKSGVKGAERDTWKQDERRKGERIVTNAVSNDSSDDFSMGGSEHSEPLPAYHGAHERLSDATNRE